MIIKQKTERYSRNILGILMLTVILSIFAVIMDMDTENVYALETFTSKDGMYTYIKINDKKIQLQSYEGTDRDLVIPSKVDGYTVARLRCNSFIEFDSITLPDSMEEIPSQTLMGCEAKKIVLGKNTTEIKNEAFWNCSNLTEIVLPDTLKLIDGKAFMNCSSLTAIRIPKSVSSVGEIGGSPFPGCGSLQSIDVDESNKNFASVDGVLFAKDENTKLCKLITYPGGKTDRSYSVPDGISEIFVEAFDDAKVVNVDLPRSLKTINVGAFEDCVSLESVNGGNDLERIEMMAFFGCISLTEFTIPESVVFIGNRAFYKDDKYTPIYPADLIETKDGDYVISSSIRIKGNKNYKSAEECFELINKERSAKGLPELVMDRSLTESAMQRAAECAIYFEHDRPDGSRYSTVDSNANGEIISAGYSTARGTVEGWMDSWSHRNVILSSDVVSTGIGSFTCNGTTYWSELFSYKGATEVYVHKANQTNAICSIGFDTSIKAVDPFIYPAEELTLRQGDDYKLTVRNENKGWKNHYCTFENDGIKWSSSDESVAAVDENGMVSAKSAGRAVITAYIDRANISTKTVTCSSNAKPPAGEDNDNNETVSISKMQAKLSQSTFTYNGTKRRPKVIISGMTEDVDYKCSGSRTSIGTGTVTVTGIGKYNGTKKLFFKVVPQTPKSRSIKPGKKSFKTVFSKVSGNTRYQIAYKQSGGKWKKKTVSYKTSGITVKKLKSRKTYYVKIRAFKTVDDKNYYGAYTKVKKVKIR